MSRMRTALSSSMRLQCSSQGWAQTYPSTPGNGSFSRTNWSASANRPWAVSCT